MSLKRKLARLVSAGPGVRAPVQAPPRSPPRSRLGDADRERRARVERMRALMNRMVADDQRRLRERRPIALDEPIELPGECIETPAGRLHHVTHYLEPHHRHGDVPIAGAVDACPVTMGKLAFDEVLEGIDPSRLLYLDTETTGLSGGAGTIPFLIGLAWFEDESLRIEQLLLRAPGEEVPMLRRLSERLEWASAVVSYNGKSFDWPLLRNRFVLNRVPVLPPAAHLDLLHCARRVFKRRLGNVRLVHMEERVLGLRREHDIDGSEIPERYWDFVRRSNGSLLAPVIEHNANDLVALAAILVTLVDRYQTLRPEHEPADQLGVAKVAVRNQDAERAERYAAAAATGGGPADVTADALLLASELARHRQDHAGQAALLARALEAAADDVTRFARFSLALAKVYEHKLRDLDHARAHALRTGPEEGDDKSEHRVARIDRKIERRDRQVDLD